MPNSFEHFHPSSKDMDQDIPGQIIVRICPPTRQDHPPSLPEIEETQSKQLPKAEALRLIELALVNTANKVDSQDDEVVRAKKSHFKADLTVYVAMGILLLAAVGIVIIKVVILDTSEDLTVPTFLPIKQEKNSNAKYVGGGFIPDYQGYIA